MAFSKETILQLIALQEKDASLDKLRLGMDKIPEEIAVFRERRETAKSRAAEAKTRLLTLEKRKKEKELELAQKEEAVRKHSMELNQVKTNEAFKALQQEIDRAKAEGSALETQILEIMEELDSGRRQEKSVQAEVAAEDKAAGAEIAALEGKLAEIKARHDKEKASRDEASAPVPPEVMRIYEHIRSRGKLNAVVAVDANHCSACRMVQAPQVIVEATKAKQIIICESCQRILYRPEALVAKAA